VFSNKAFTNELSPFLMFDYAAPKEFPPTTSRKQRGVGQHPHRGFETVTIAFQGEVEHADSAGNRGIIGPGDVQWMTAARGIVHEEFHAKEWSKNGGIFEMCQLWVNLPSKFKMTKPKYQPILNNDIPKAELLPVAVKDDNNQDEKVCSTESSIPFENGFVRIIAGEFQNVKGPANTFTPINMWDVCILNQKLTFEFTIPEGHTTLVFVRRGKIKVRGDGGNDAVLNLADMVIMSESGSSLRLQSQEEDTSVLILTGEPIDEPIAARGPFVMNTNQELMEAFTDYQNGRNGF
jgi:hypothetical protein